MDRIDILLSLPSLFLSYSIFIIDHPIILIIIIPHSPTIILAHIINTDILIRYNIIETVSESKDSNNSAHYFFSRGFSAEDFNYIREKDDFNDDIFSKNDNQNYINLIIRLVSSL